MKKDCFGGPGQWYKGNLHSHTTNSDGHLTPAQAVALFRQYGSLRVMAAAAEMSGKVAAPALPFPLASLSGKPRETLAAILAELALA